MRLDKLSPDKIKVADRERKEFGDIAGLASSIKEKGLIQPITVDEDFNLLAGERRLRAVKEAGITEIPVIIRSVADHLDSKEIELVENLERLDFTWVERVQALAKINRMGIEKHGDKWSIRRLAKMIGGTKSSVHRHLEMARAVSKIPQLADCDTEEEARRTVARMQEELVVQELQRRIKGQDGELPGDDFLGEGKVTDAEYEDIVDDIGKMQREMYAGQDGSEEDEAEEEEEETPEARKKRLARQKDLVTKLLAYAAQIYTVQDFFEAPEVEGGYHFIECDPPYGINLQKSKRRSEEADAETKGNLHAYNEIDIGEYPDFLLRVTQQLYEHAAKDCWLVFWHGPEWAGHVYGALNQAGWKVDKIPAIWYKGPIGQTQQPQINLARSYEQFFVARKGEPVLAKPGRSNVFSFAPVSPKQKYHPTQRPIQLMEEILDTFCFPSMRMLVPFAGSGVTLRASILRNIKAAGYDLEDTYRDRYLLAVNRDFEGEEDA